jgi:hypothetical protein
MKSSRLSVLFASVMCAAAASAATIDMDDPRRAVGREDDIRVDAQLMQDTVSPATHLVVNYQIENFTSAAVAVAEKECVISYDADTRTITIGVGAEIPDDGELPRMTVVPAGQKKSFTASGVLRVLFSRVRSPLTATPREVQIKVTVLRDLRPFTALIQRQAETPQKESIALSDAQFEKWMEATDTIFLNSIPVRFDPRGRGGVDAEKQSADLH